MSKTFLFAVLMFLADPGSYAQGQSTAQKIAIKASRLIDVRSGKLISDPVILVEGDKIMKVGSRLSIPKGSKVIELGDVTLLPGLIDVHTHLLHQYYARVGDDDVNRMTEMVDLSAAERAKLGEKLAREMLVAGFTSVRDLGNSGTNLDVALRNAINRGDTIGPRMFVSTRALSPVGGQFQTVTPEVQRMVGQEYVQISNEEEAREAVRQAALEGADLIKVIVNAGSRRLTQAEMSAIVDEARKVHLRVAAHATDGDGPAMLAVAAGVNSIEHAYTISDSVLALMAAKNIFLVPTDAANVPKYQARIQRALKAGVRIAIGSDIYYEFDGKSRGQASAGMYKTYSAAGMSNIDILRAATIGPAELIGNNMIGAIEPGRYADIIAVPGNPLTDIGLLEQVVFVMKGGGRVR